MGSFGVYYIGFASDNRLVTISDAARVWDLSTGRELQSLAMECRARWRSVVVDGGLTLSPDGTQLMLSPKIVKYGLLISAQVGKFVALETA
jgi:hypothetical protein